MQQANKPRAALPVRAGRADTRAERRLDAAILGGGLAAAIIGCLALALTLPPEARAGSIAALGFYCTALVAMLSFALAYNVARAPRARAILRRLDHAAIFLMIAGTYTPFAVVTIGGTWGWTLIGFVWAGALAGMVLKLGWPHRFERSSVVAYLVLGWAVLAAVPPMLEHVPTSALILLATGGVLYSAGVAFHVARRMPFQNEAWHACVVAAATCHFAAVVLGVLPAT
ncbi:hemolysin III family protein [Roseomonas eburnea]|uniref:Hemolysin III family protein n=1 Tax=Neoroseomonas eburnea TaxID=1346889 RepID=A0A9X9XEV4_9PROT|nr:hemolysin III family protein [Neoroseomonas eburnea]MBR0682240.1 hemolysin III family protein [Neoroseomonas eburnea]